MRAGCGSEGGSWNSKAWFITASSCRTTRRRCPRGRACASPAPPDGPKTFGESYARFKGAAGGLPADDGDAEEGAAYVNEVMAEDDKDDPYLESYQHYGKAT